MIRSMQFPTDGGPKRSYRSIANELGVSMGGVRGVLSDYNRTEAGRAASGANQKRWTDGEVEASMPKNSQTMAR